ncbi:hypothetical protein LEMLEM_LOCUS6190, partial [Lemmus lemmus]
MSRNSPISAKGLLSGEDFLHGQNQSTRAYSADFRTPAHTSPFPPPSQNLKDSLCNPGCPGTLQTRLPQAYRFICLLSAGTKNPHHHAWM